MFHIWGQVRFASTHLIDNIPNFFQNYEKFLVTKRSEYTKILRFYKNISHGPPPESKGTKIYYTIVMVIFGSLFVNWGQ